MDGRKEIRKIIKEVLDNIGISQIITSTANDYRKKNKCSLWDINNGLCNEFSQEVIGKMGGDSENLYELSGDMFFDVRDPGFALENWKNTIETDYGVWGKDLLDYWGWPPNVDISKVDDELNHSSPSISRVLLKQ